MGRKISDSEKHLLIKFDCWHIEYYRFIKESFPDVPSIFVYRLPMEVVESHLRMKGMQMIPGMVKSKLLEINEPVLTAEDLQMYLVNVLKRIFQAGVNEIIKNETLLLNYNSLPSISWTILLDYFNISHSTDDIEIIKHRSKFDAKNTNLEFNSKKPPNWSPVPEQLKIAVSEKLDPLYKKLEEIRMEQENQLKFFSV